MGDWKQWSDWLREGFFISYWREGIEYYEHIVMRDLAHWEYDWEETIVHGQPSGPFVPATLEITKGYEERTNTNHIWQMIFGIKGQAYIYVELPTDLHRHGIPKAPKPNTTMRRTSHFEEYMSEFHEPTFLTEHFMMRPETFQIEFSAYNPHDIDLTDVTLNIFIAKMVTDRIGTNDYGVLSTPKITANESLTAKLERRWRNTLEKLYRREVPCRPITLLPVRAPAEAPA